MNLILSINIFGKTSAKNSQVVILKNKQVDTLTASLLGNILDKKEFIREAKGVIVAAVEVVITECKKLLMPQTLPNFETERYIEN